MIREEAEHAVRAVTVDIRVLAGRDVAIPVAEIGTDAPVDADRMEILPLIVAQHRKRLNLAFVTVAQEIHVVGVLIAIDAAPDPVALGVDADRLGDFDPAVVLHADLAVEGQDAFAGVRGRHRDQHQQPERSHSMLPSSTSGTAAASSEDFWKNGRSSKPNKRATTLLGTVAVIVL